MVTDASEVAGSIYSIDFDAWLECSTDTSLLIPFHWCLSTDALKLEISNWNLKLRKDQQKLLAQVYLFWNLKFAT